MQPLQYVMPPGVLTGSLSWSLHMEQVSASDTSTIRVMLLEPPAAMLADKAADPTWAELENATSSCLAAAYRDPNVSPHVRFAPPYETFTNFCKDGLSRTHGAKAHHLVPRKPGLLSSHWVDQDYCSVDAPGIIPSALLSFMRANLAAASIITPLLAVLVYVCPDGCDPIAVSDSWSQWANLAQ
jgi:hypothetical protein